MLDYKFKTTPFAHQIEAFNLCKHRETYALFMEQGTGKTKVAIDKAAHQFCEGHINAVLIVAPNGVHTNWINREIPAHLPDYIQHAALAWKNTKAFDKRFDAAIANPNLVFFSINVEAIITDRGKKLVRRFLDVRNVLMIIDESSRIKTPKAMRTRAAINFGKSAKQRLILTGTPVTQSPFDLYTQMKFLDADILGASTYTAFKHEYGVFTRKLNNRIGRWYDELECYKNLDQLQTLIKNHSYRVTKQDCLDLPDKIYQRYQVELTREQQIHYDNLKTELLTKVGDTEIITPIVLTQLLRLQQITGGFLTQENNVYSIGATNPKLNLMLELLEDVQGKVIIWSRFTAEIQLIVAALKNNFGANSTVEYWGEVTSLERERAVNAFQCEKDARFFVGNARAGGLGLTLTAANTMIYFSNDFSLETRLQSEDRAHRIGQKNNVLYIDIEAINTVDSKIIEALVNKKNIADTITGDKLKEWL